MVGVLVFQFNIEALWDKKKDLSIVTFHRVVLLIGRGLLIAFLLLSIHGDKISTDVAVKIEIE